MAEHFDYVAHGTAMRAAGWWQDKTPDDLLERVIARDPDKKAIVAYRMDKGFDAPFETLTYGELGDAVSRAAGAFRKLGVGKGDVVAIMLPNWWEFVVAAYALSRIGAVPNPLMHIFRERELRFMLGFADTKAIIIPKAFRGFDFEKMLDGLKPELPKLQHIIVVDGEGERSFDRLVMQSDAKPIPASEGTPPAPDEMAVLMYTSGTTGEPKGVMHCFNTLIACCEALGTRFGLTTADVHMGSTPFGHMTGYAAVMFQSLYYGSTVVLQDVWEPKAAVAIMVREVASQGGGMAAASSVHINLFGPHPIVVFGNHEQKQEWIPRLVAGEDKVAFGVTEPDAGLDTTRIKTFAEKVPGGYKVRGQKVWTSTAQVASKIMLLTRTTRYEDCKRPTDGITIFYTNLDRSKIEVQRIPKMGRKAVDSNAIFIEDLFIPDEHRIGEEGKGFSYLLHSLNPERVLVGTEAVAIGRDALGRAARYAKERVVFGRPIGQNQGIQHPLAEKWMYLESAWLMLMKAAELYDTGKPCGAEANAGKFLGARAGYDACLQAVLTHGGFGYAKEYHVERLLREVTVTRIAPVTEQLIQSFIAERVLDLPKSY